MNWKIRAIPCLLAGLSPLHAQQTVVTFAGEYSAATSYIKSAITVENGVAYMSLGADNQGHEPASSPTYWIALAPSTAASSTSTGTTPVSAGPQGPAGPAGPQGSQGPTGPAGPQGPPVSFRGAWAASATYAAGDAVSFTDGSSYISLVSGNRGVTPGTSSGVWAVLAAGASGTATTSAALAQQAIAVLPQQMNLFDASAAIAGTAIRTDTGLPAPFADKSSTNFIPVYGQTSIVSSARTDDTNNLYGYAFYGADKTTVVAGGNAAAGAPIAIPPGAFWYRQYFQSVNLTNVVIAWGKTLPSTYRAFGTVDSATMSTQISAAIASAKPAASANGAGQPLRIGVLGDSISTAFYQAWQNVVLARTGAQLVYQDSRAGRSFDSALECYGSPRVGGTIGTFNHNITDPAFGPICAAPGDTGNTDGNTLAQNLANVDLLIVYLGTNDIGLSQQGRLGTITDAPGPATFYSQMQWVITALLTANPHMRLVMVTDEYNTWNAASDTRAIADAEVAYGQSMGIPVLNLFEKGGSNPLTVGAYSRDGLHPSDWAFTHVVGPAIANFIQQWY